MAAARSNWVAAAEIGREVEQRARTETNSIAKQQLLDTQLQKLHLVLSMAAFSHCSAPARRHMHSSSNINHMVLL